MTIYKLIKSGIENKVGSVFRDYKDSIPFDPANTDYQQFKADIEDGAELQDADGNVMSAEAVAEFLKTLG